MALRHSPKQRMRCPPDIALPDHYPEVIHVPGPAVASNRPEIGHSHRIHEEGVRRTVGFVADTADVSETVDTVTLAAAAAQGSEVFDRPAGSRAPADGVGIPVAVRARSGNIATIA